MILKQQELKWYGILTLIMLIWATNYLVIKLLLTATSPSTLVVYRFIFAALTLAIVVLPRLKQTHSKLQLTLQDWILLVIAGTCDIIIAGFGIAYSIALAGASVTALLINSNLIFVTIFTLFLKLERWSGIKILGVIISLIGMIIVVLRNNADFNLGLNAAQFGMLLAIFGSISIAVSALINKRLAKKMSGLIYTFYSIIPAGGLLVMILLFTQPQVFTLHSWSELISLAYFGILGTGIAWSIMASSYQILPTSTIASIKLLAPIFTAILAYSILGERFTRLVIVGMILTIIGIFLVIKGNKINIIKYT